MKEEIIYTYILIKTDGTYLGWSKEKSVDSSGSGMQWVKWNKTLPEDMDTKQYTVTELETWYTDNYNENGELRAV